MIPQAFLDQYGMIIAIILFALTYVLMLTFSKVRPYIALGSAVLFIATGMLPLSEIWGTGLDMSSLNVLLMIAGTMGLVALFIESKMPELLADLVLSCCPNVMVAAVALSLFAGIISAFVDNVATVLMIAPVALEICKKLKTNPVPFIIAIAVSCFSKRSATVLATHLPGTAGGAEHLRPALIQCSVGVGIFSSVSFFAICVGPKPSTQRANILRTLCFWFRFFPARRSVVYYRQ